MIEKNIIFEIIVLCGKYIIINVKIVDYRDVERIV